MAAKKRKATGYWTEIGYVNTSATPESLQSRMKEIGLVLAAMKKIRRTVRVTTNKYSDSGIVFQAFRK